MLRRENEDIVSSTWPREPLPMVLPPTRHLSRRSRLIPLTVGVGFCRIDRPGGTGRLQPRGGISACQSIDCLAQEPNRQLLR
jgi:hypothetical protein